jgi:hypothetical protein
LSGCRCWACLCLPACLPGCQSASQPASACLPASQAGSARLPVLSESESECESTARLSPKPGCDESESDRRHGRQVTRRDDSGCREISAAGGRRTQAPSRSRSRCHRRRSLAVWQHGIIKFKFRQQGASRDSDCAPQAHGRGRWARCRSCGRYRDRDCGQPERPGSFRVELSRDSDTVTTGRAA